MSSVEDASGDEPTLVKRQLSRELKRLRERAGKTHEDVHRARLASTSKMSRIESGKEAVKEGDVWALCALYRASPEETEATVELARGANQKGWVEEFDGVVPDWLGIYAGLEGAAAQIETYDPELVHALVQTREYARAVIGTAEGVSTKTLEQLVEFRMKRQKKALTGHPQGRMPTIIRCLIGEAALRYSVGQPDVMQAQIAHLAELADRVDIRIRPFSAGLHPWMNGSFAMLRFRDPADPPVVYMDTHTGARYLEAEKHLTEYRKIFDKLFSEGIPIKEFRL